MVLSLECIQEAIASPTMSLHPGLNRCRSFLGSLRWSPQWSPCFCLIPFHLFSTEKPGRLFKNDVPLCSFSAQKAQPQPEQTRKEWKLKSFSSPGRCVVSFHFSRVQLCPGHPRPLALSGISPSAPAFLVATLFQKAPPTFSESWLTSSFWGAGVGGRAEEVRGILVPRKKMEPGLPAWERWSFNHWAASEVCLLLLLNKAVPCDCSLLSTQARSI